MVLATNMGPIGAGLVLLGAGLGIGILCGFAIQAMARQPEMINKLQLAMLIGAALIEGVALFGLVICMRAA